MLSSVGAKEFLKRKPILHVKVSVAVNLKEIAGFFKDNRDGFK